MISPWILTIIGCLLHFQTTTAELRLIQTVFRHGNRAPTEPLFYPNDPYMNNTYQPMGIGGLTNTGKQSVYKLGEFFRARYGKFLGPIYSRDLIYFRADEIDRIVMTGQLVAAGLFPPAKIQRWNPYLDWQPIPVWAPPQTTDVLYNGIFCQNHKLWRAEVENTDSFLLKRRESLRGVFDYLSVHAGINMTQLTALFLRQQLFAQNDLGLKLPSWTKAVVPNGVLDEIAAFDFVIQSYTRELKQLMGGVWIREWLNHVERHLARADKRKAFMYAAHELNIAAILVALNNFDYRTPSYSSSVMFELHEIKNELFVQVLHKDKDNVRILIVPGCDCEMCPLKIFREIVAPIVPDDPTEVCGGIDFDLLS